jgi:hypothetical protein
MPYPMRTRWGRLAAVALGVIAVLWITNWAAVRAGGWAPHAAYHLSSGLVGVMLAAVGVGLLRGLQATPIPRAGRIGPVAFVAGSAWFAASQLLETMSVVIEHPTFGMLHTATGLSTVLGALPAMMGLALTAFLALTGWSMSLREVLPLAVIGAFTLFVFTIGGFGPLVAVGAFVFLVLLLVVLIRRRKRHP